MTFRNDDLPTGNNNHLVNTSGFSDKPLWNLINQVDSFFNQFFNQMNTHLIPDSLSVNTYETETDVCVDVKLPGCNQNQIQLEIEGNKLKIGVENSFQEEVKYPTHTGRKQFYQRREHLVSLPFTIPDEDTKVSFQNEVLTISFPKEDMKRRYLTIDDESV